MSLPSLNKVITYLLTYFGSDNLEPIHKCKNGSWDGTKKGDNRMITIIIIIIIGALGLLIFIIIFIISIIFKKNHYWMKLDKIWKENRLMNVENSR